MPPQEDRAQATTIKQGPQACLQQFSAFVCQCHVALHNPSQFYAQLNLIICVFLCNSQCSGSCASCCLCQLSIGRHDIRRSCQKQRDQRVESSCSATDKIADSTLGLCVRIIQHRSEVDSATLSLCV